MRFWSSLSEPARQTKSTKCMFNVPMNQEWHILSGNLFQITFFSAATRTEISFNEVFQCKMNMRPSSFISCRHKRYQLFPVKCLQAAKVKVLNNLQIKRRWKRKHIKKKNTKQNVRRDGKTQQQKSFKGEATVSIKQCILVFLFICLVVCQVQEAKVEHERRIKRYKKKLRENAEGSETKGFDVQCVPLCFCSLQMLRNASGFPGLTREKEKLVQTSVSGAGLCGAFLQLERHKSFLSYTITLTDAEKDTFDKG